MSPIRRLTELYNYDIYDLNASKSPRILIHANHRINRNLIIAVDLVFWADQHYQRLYSVHRKVCTEYAFFPPSVTPKKDI
ncbi:hypothetical protein ACN38_g5935 [Penicillium nordicum]|uniref:Uncharacterized protein n=1 Tax=Penicillium nordicum TaxID=229535 RepID=A0A0M8P1F6_9EURO|nr:hypothetical protein ACN38_g5935 [Penicillium nordicum]